MLGHNSKHCNLVKYQGVNWLFDHKYTLYFKFFLFILFQGIYLTIMILYHRCSMSKLYIKMIEGDNMKMKLVAIALSGAFLASSAASALDFDPKFYIGGEVQANRQTGVKQIKTPAGNPLTATDKKKSLFGKSGSGASAIVGTKLNENIGVEIGFTGLTGNKISIANTATNAFKTNNALKTKSHNLYADVLGYVPVTNEVDLIGSVGVGRLRTKMCGKLVTATGKALETVSMKSSKTGVRVGAGAQYKLSENLNARFMVRHQKGNKFVKSVNSAGLGLFYQF